MAANNADLGALALADAPNGLQRCGYLVPGDSPCLPMQPSSSACSLVAFVGTVATATVPANRLNVTVVTSGTLRPGLVMPAGVFGAGTIIASQLSGTPGGVGVYQVSQPFSPPASLALTVRGDGASQVPSADGGCWVAAGNAADIRQFGAVCDGTTVDAFAIDAAIAAVGAAGSGTVTVPAGKTCNVGSGGVTLGNGSSTAASTYSSVRLVGDGAPINGFLGGLPTAAPKLIGSGASPIVTIAGPLAGWAVQNLQLVCTGSNGTGLLYVSASYGDSRDFTVTGCKFPLKAESVSANPIGVSHTDVIHNSFQNFGLEVPDTDGAIGINLNPTGFADADYNVFENGTVTFDTGIGGHTRTCIYVGYADSDAMKDVHCLRGGGDVSTLRGVVIDYSSVGGSLFPGGEVFNHLDVGVADTQWSNIGTPSNSASPNWVLNDNLTNGGVYPLLANLLPDHAAGTCTPRLIGASTAGTTGLSTAICNWTMEGWKTDVSFNTVVNGSGITGGAAGQLTLTGLPFAVDATPPSNGSCAFSIIAKWTAQATFTTLGCYGNNGLTSAVFWETNATGSFVAPMNITELTAGSQITGVLGYKRAK